MILPSSPPLVNILFNSPNTHKIHKYVKNVGHVAAACPVYVLVKNRCIMTLEKDQEQNMSNFSALFRNGTKQRV